MVDLTLPLSDLSPVARKGIVARFNGGRLILREIERRLEVADRLAACIGDPLGPDITMHTLATSFASGC